MQFEWATAARAKKASEEIGRQSEDAWFASSRVLCVADGVGSWWSQRQIDSGEYARNLCNHVALVAQDHDHPCSVMRSAHEHVPKQGSATLCVAFLDGNILNVANLGDSRYLVVRGGEIVATCRTQQFKFNAPYQFGQDSPYTASDADISDVIMWPGDIVLMATDGLWDNLNDAEVLRIINNSFNTAEALLERAWAVSLDENADTPFGINAVALGYDNLAGGKPDDITVVVGVVVVSARLKRLRRYSTADPE